MANDYDLSINKYKKIIYKKIEYPPISKIIADLKSLDGKISKELEELEEVLIDSENIV